MQKINITYDYIRGVAVGKFGYDPDLVKVIKSVGFTPKYENKKFICWEMAVNKQTENAFNQIKEDPRFDISPAVYAALDSSFEWEQENYFLSSSDGLNFDFQISPVIDSYIKGYQKAGVHFITRNMRGVLVGDEMGLGKTLTSIAAVEYAKDRSYPVLIVCPAVVKINWFKEIQKWSPDRSIYIFKSAIEWDSKVEADFYIINYDILEKKWRQLREVNFQTIICDESHYLKNYKSARTLRIKELSKDIKHKILLSGTPVLNRPAELMPQLEIIDRLSDFGGFWSFANKYCQAYKSRFGWDFSGAANLEDLNRKMRSSCYLRRNKEDVLKDLPPKRRVELYVGLSNWTEYKKAEADLITHLKENARLEKSFLESINAMSEEEKNRAIADYRMDKANRAKRAEVIVKMNELAQLSAIGKMDSVKTWLNNFFEENPNKKIVVFAWHKEIVLALAEKYKCNAINGESSAEDRAAYVEDFQKNEDTKMIVCNIQAGGVGITLTAADTSLFIEQGWNPGTMQQAEDRIHRIGQEESVTIYYMLGEQTIDISKYKMIWTDKEKIVNTIGGGVGYIRDEILKESM